MSFLRRIWFLEQGRNKSFKQRHYNAPTIRNGEMHLIFFSPMQTRTWSCVSFKLSVVMNKGTTSPLCMPAYVGGL